MDIEGDDGFPGKIILIKEAVHRHREIRPPVGIADENGIVLIQVFDVCGELRTGVFTLLLGGVIDQLSAVGRVYHRGMDGKQIASHIFLNHVRDHAEPSEGFAVDLRIACGGHRVHAAVFRSSEIGDQNVAAALLCRAFRRGSGPSRAFLSRGVRSGLFRCLRFGCFRVLCLSGGYLRCGGTLRGCAPSSASAGAERNGQGCRQSRNGKRCSLFPSEMNHGLTTPSCENDNRKLSRFSRNFACIVPGCGFFRKFPFVMVLKLKGLQRGFPLTRARKAS